MFKNLFKKAENKRDIDQLIFDIAEYQRNKDYEILFKLITTTKFFCPVDEKSAAHIPRGEKYVTKSGDDLKIPMAEINGLRLAVIFTAFEDKRIGESYFEIDGIDALEMVLKSNDVSGILIQNREISWVGLDKQKIRWILSQYKT